MAVRSDRSDRSDRDRPSDRAGPSQPTGAFHGDPAPARTRRAGSRRRRARRDASREADDDVLVAELYRRYRGPLLSFVLRLTAGDRQRAEDVVQETMLRAWRQAGELDQDGRSLMPWLATVARRIVIDEQRRRNARPAETDEGMLTKTPVPDWTDDLLRSVIVADALRAAGQAGVRGVVVSSQHTDA